MFLGPRSACDIVRVSPSEKSLLFSNQFYALGHKILDITI